MKACSFLFSFLLLIGCCSLNLAQEATPSPSPGVDPSPLTRLPERVLEAELQSARGLPFKLSDYSGKVLVVNLWATWLGPSLQEVPSLVKLQKDYWSRAVRVVGLSTEDPEQSRAEVGEFVRRFAIQYKIGWASPDVAKTLFQERDAVPQTYVISPSGKIVRRFVGFNQVVTPRQVRAAVDEALQDKPPPSKTTSP